MESQAFLLNRRAPPWENPVLLAVQLIVIFGFPEVFRYPSNYRR